jgi:hypothetical protein
MYGLQQALWLPEAKGRFVVGARAIERPGPGELLVKIEAVALNTVSFVNATRVFLQSAHSNAQADWRIQKFASVGRVRTCRIYRVIRV